MISSEIWMGKGDWFMFKAKQSKNILLIFYNVDAYEDNLQE